MKKFKILIAFSLLTLCTACPQGEDEYSKYERRTGFYF